MFAVLDLLLLLSLFLILETFQEHSFRIHKNSTLYELALNFYYSSESWIPIITNWAVTACTVQLYRAHLEAGAYLWSVRFFPHILPLWSDIVLNFMFI